MKKHLGQHFLINKPAIGKIISALDLKPDDMIIEIGPGEGALTFPILEQCKKLNCKVIAIEKDEKLASSLELLAFSKNLKIEILKGDALKIIPEITKSSKLKAQSYKIVGNIPYYITGKLLRLLSELTTGNKQLTTIILMIQKEVAERIIAKPPRNNLLAAAVQFWAKPKILLPLKPTDFEPPPKVSSAVIKIEPITNNLAIPETDRFYEMIRIIFKQPRKTLINNLKEGTDLSRVEIERALSELKMDQKSRPQDLNIEKIKKLARIINK